MLSNVTRSVPNQHDSDRQSLLTHLLDAVKQCQIRFGGKTELASESDSRVCCLCACWEAVLQHGLKHTNKALSTLKQVTEITGLAKIGTGLGLLDDIKKMETEPSFWHVVKPMLTAHELQRFMSLKQMSTEEGRGRAWLRAALNEHSIERYMHQLAENSQHLSIFYEEWAFLRDSERSAMLPNMARGLASILFAINIDNPELNSIKPATGLDTLVSMSMPSTPSYILPAVSSPEPQPVIGGETVDREKRKEKKKKRKPAKIVSFDADDSSYSGSPRSSIASPLSKSSSFDLNSPIRVPLNKNQARPTAFVFPNLALEPVMSSANKPEDGRNSEATSSSEVVLGAYNHRPDAKPEDVKNSEATSSSEVLLGAYNHKLDAKPDDVKSESTSSSEVLLGAYNHRPDAKSEDLKSESSVKSDDFMSESVNREREDSSKTSDNESEKSGSMDNFALREEAFKMEGGKDVEGEDNDRYSEENAAPKRRQKFPGVNDLDFSGIKSWHDVLGIDNVDKNKDSGATQMVEENYETADRLNDKHSADVRSKVKVEVEEECYEYSLVDTLSENMDGHQDSSDSNSISEANSPNRSAKLKAKTPDTDTISTNSLTLSLKDTIETNAALSAKRHFEKDAISCSSEDRVTVTHTPAATIKMAGAISTASKKSGDLSACKLHTVQSSPSFTTNSSASTSNETFIRKNTSTVSKDDDVRSRSGGTGSQSKLELKESTPTSSNTSKSKTSQNRSSLSTVKSMPIMTDPGKEIDPFRVRTLPSGNSVDNADAQSNLSFGSMSSTGETFAMFSGGTLANDVNLVPVNPDGKSELTDLRMDSGSTTGSMDSYGLYNEATESAMQAVALAQQGFLTSLRTQGDGSNAPKSASPGGGNATHDTMTTGELKQAVIAMMMRKDEVEDNNKMLRQMLEDETERTGSLKAQIEEIKSESQSQQDSDAEKIREITRENDLLKHQLRKYVSTVQMLRNQGASDEVFNGLHLDSSVQPSIPPVSQHQHSHETGEYEKKLVQVAEMHGELIELNERLQKQVQNKDGIIKRMRAELEDLRGPLPRDLHDNADVASIHSETSEINNRSLINIWIPSAFLRGTSKETYHVYQVYIRIRDEEWNVYRRYTEFREMHLKLKKTYPTVAALDFPPKKSIGSKDSRFVEQRRKKLQVYLRKMLNNLAYTNPELCTLGCKQRLISMLPLFGSQPVQDKKTKKRERERSRSTGRNAAALSTSTVGHVYDGL